MQGDLARLGKNHQLRELVIGADDVPDDVALGGDDVEGRDADRAAVADDVVGASPARHREPVVLRALLGDEVKYYLGPGTAGQLADGGHLAAIGDHRVMGAELLGELERFGIAVDDDDRGRGERSQALDADVAKAARADKHAGGARIQQRESLTDRVICRDPGVGERRDILRLGLRVEPDARAGRGEQVVGHPAVSRQAGERAVDAVHVIPGPAGPPAWLAPGGEGPC